jgi:hypothetical protein
MPRHVDPLLSFDVPRDWQDRTVVAYAAPGADGATAANLVMTRDELDEDEDFEGYADRQLAALAQRLKGFALEKRAKLEIGGRPAIGLSFVSRGANGMLVQRLTIVALPDRKIAAFTTTVPERDAEQLDPLFDHILASVRLDGTASP